VSELRTERLSLDRVKADDADFVLELLNDPGWLANIGDRGVHTSDEARAYIADRFDRSYWLVARDAATGEPLGLCGIVDGRPGLDMSDLGYAFLARHSGEGYATEAARAVLAHALGPLEHQRLAAITALENIPSQRVLEKIGFRRLGVKRLPDYPDDSAYFEIP
jgi:ribosomal-protein-alanine N-acetyltransferase